MKIGMLVNNLNVSGGYQKLVVRLSEQLVNNGHEVIIYTLSINDQVCYPEIIKNLRVISIPFSYKRNNKLFNKINDLIFGKIIIISKIRKLAKLIKKDTELLIIHDEICLHSLNWIKKRNNIKIIWMLNNQLSDEFDNIYKIIINNFKKLKNIKDLAINLCLIPQILVNHISLKLSIRKVDKFAVYDSINQKLIKNKIGKEAYIVFAGADLNEYQKFFKKKFSKYKNKYTILSVGIFFPHRRYEDIIEAISILKNEKIKVNLIIVGRQDQHIEYSASIIKKVKELKLEEEIIFKQKVSNEEMIELYENSDIFCFVNNGFTWGISVFEAMAIGLPVIITNNIGAADLIKNEINGFIVTPCSPKEIATTIKKIINYKEIDTLINKAYEDIKNILSWKEFSKRIFNLIYEK